MIHSSFFSSKHPVLFGNQPDKPNLSVPYTGTKTNARIDRSKPTSTLDPILQAVRTGAEMLEFDAHLVDKSRLMVTPRANGTGFSQSYLDSAMTTLDEVFDAIPEHVQIMLELKAPYGYFPKFNKKFEKTLVDFIKTRGVADRMMIVGFSPPMLARLKKVAKKEGITLQTGNEVYFPRYQGSEKTLSDKAHRRGLPYINWVAGLSRRQEKKRFDSMIENGVDGLVSNMSEGLRDHLETSQTEKPTTKASEPKFSGDIGKRGQDNIYPNFVIKHALQRGDLEKHWQSAKKTYIERISLIEKQTGFDEGTMASIHDLIKAVMKFPKGFSLEFTDEVFKNFSDRLSEPEQERLNYSLERMGVFWADHFGSILENLRNESQWNAVQWFFNGLMKHPDNHHIMLSAKPIGLVTRPLGHALELENDPDKTSPYWQTFETLTRYMKNVLAESFTEPVIIKKDKNDEWVVNTKKEVTRSKVRKAYQTEQARFATVLYELMMNTPPQHRVNPVLTKFITENLEDILDTFTQNFPPPKVITKNEKGEWQGHPDYFEKLQQHITSNVVRLIQKTDVASQTPITQQLPHGEQRPTIVAHGPLNHLYWPRKKD